MKRNSIRSSLNETLENSVKPRIDWVDYAKGFCIIFVVMFHSTLGVGDALGQTGFMHNIVEWARPFRMPDFFFISGLFLASSLHKPWRTYLDRKVVHFLYFFVLWALIQYGLKAPLHYKELGIVGVIQNFFLLFVQPSITLWFIYILPIFFVVTRLLRPVPVLVVWGCAALLEMSHLHTSSIVVNEFASRFVYFYSGYILASYAFEAARYARSLKLMACLGLVLWAVINGVLVSQGISQMPVLSLLMGYCGVAAVIVISTLLADLKMMAPLRYMGENSIVIYLMFFLPMGVTRTILIKSGLITDVGMISLIVTIVAVIVPLAFHYYAKKTWLWFLFKRPDRFKLTLKAHRLTAAE
jgi:uncharacterized membrane protein YcfT